MKSATRMLLLAATFLLGGSAWAQNAQVTFQVDLNQAIDFCRLDPDTETPELRGSMNDWSGTPMADEDGDGIYTLTVELAKGSQQSYKFYAPLGDGDSANYETGNDRTYTVTEEDEQKLPVATFNYNNLTNGCNTTTANYEVQFSVDMSVAKLNPTIFNPEKDIVVMAGEINNWTTTADTLFPGRNPDIHSNVVFWENAELPAAGETRNVEYKFVIGRTPGEAPGGWESISNRTFPITGNEQDTDGNGYLEVTVPVSFFNNNTPDRVLLEETTVKIEVDMRPAYYYLADNDRLPPDTQTGDPVTTFTGVAVNGPVAGLSDGRNDWLTWGASDLFLVPDRVFRDDGTQGDVTAGDSIFTQTFVYGPGTGSIAVGKFGAEGWDNEAAFGGDTHFDLKAAAEGNGVIRHVFGAIRLADGTYTDLRGPVEPGTDTPLPRYDPYIMISEDSLTVTVVRRGGEHTSVEDIGGAIPAAFTLDAAYPNPFAGTTQFTYTLPQAQHVTVRVYDVTGRAVATLVDEFQAASTYEVTFSGDNLPSGVYFYQVQAGGQSVVRTMTLVR